MKKIFLKYVSVAAACLLSASCAQDEPAMPNHQAFEITVTDAGYTTDSRAAEQGLTTIFTDGDQIGVYAVKNGAIVNGIDNICLTAKGDDDNLTWVVPQGIELSAPAGVTFYAYYPYTAQLEGTYDLTATEANEFFADIEKNWTVNKDQSSYDNYTASDFMTAKGVLSAKNLDFSMKHRMTLLKVYLPGEKYTFDNTPEIPDYVVSVSSNAAFNNGVKPMVAADGAFVVLANPAKTDDMTVAGSYNNGVAQRSFRFVSKAAAGTVNSYRVDGGFKSHNHTLQIGDYFLADGNLLSKDATAEEVAKADVVGIVYNIDPSRIGDAEKNALGGVVHGSVMATLLVTEPYNGSLIWCETTNDDTQIGLSAVLGGDGHETAAKALKEISGYADLQNVMLRSTNPADFEAIYNTSLFGKDFNDADKLKALTTGWYLPAFGQVADICRNLGGAELTSEDVTPSSWADVFFWAGKGAMTDNINAYMSKIPQSKCTYIAINHWYWASTQISKQYAVIYNITNSAAATLQTVNFSGGTKNNNANRCRAVLTF